MNNNIGINLNRGTLYQLRYSSYCKFQYQFHSIHNSTLGGKNIFSFVEHDQRCKRYFKRYDYVRVHVTNSIGSPRKEINEKCDENATISNALLHTVNAEVSCMH
jgi:hypothetical protein